MDDNKKTKAELIYELRQLRKKLAESQAFETGPWTAEKKLFPHHEDFIESVVQSIGDGLYVVDRNLRITLWNKAMEEISGFTAEETKGKLIHDIFSHYLDEDVDELSVLNDALSGQVVVLTCISYETAKGKSGYLHEKFLPLKNRADEVVGVVVVVEDVTELRRMETQVEKLKEELEARKLVEVAKGLIMEQFGKAESEAYRFIRSKSQEERRKMVEVAKEIIEMLGTSRREHQAT